MRPDLGAMLGALVEAKVQFVVVGEPTDGATLRVVVSQHPTNLDAMGRVLDRLGATLRRAEAPAVPQVRRIADPLGTISVTTPAGDLDLVMGVTGGATYAETLAVSHGRDLGGQRVRWAAEPALVAARHPSSSAAVSRRLLRLAGDLSHLVDASDDEGRGPTGSPDDEPR